MKTTHRLTREEIRDLYRQDYVARHKERHEDRRLNRLLPLIDLSPQMVVADIGCGDGHLLHLLGDKVGEYHGVDFSSEFIDAARRDQSAAGITNATFHCASVVDFLSAKDCHYDRVFAMDFTEHVYDDELLLILTAVRTSLKPSGRLYVHTPDRTFFLEWFKARGILRQLPGHIAVRTAEKYRALVRAAGFREVHVRHLAHYLPILSWIHIFSRVPLVGKYLRARLFIECVA